LLAVDRAFAEVKGSDRPGCAVGVARDGKTVLTRAYRMANVEDGTPNR
jgi:CubicO group peptidase (beta-lactamase class C family)